MTANTMKATDEVHFYCVLCGVPMKAGSELAENVCECPRCFRFVPVPPESAKESPQWPQIYPPDVIAIEIKFPCSECGSKLEIDARSAGDTVYCPICTSAIKSPHLAFLIMPPLSVAPKSKIEFAKPAINLSPQEIDFLNSVKPDAHAPVGKSRTNALKR